MEVSGFFSHGQTPAQVMIFTAVFIVCWNLENIFGVTENYRKMRHDATNFGFIMPGAVIQLLLGVVFVRFLAFENLNGYGLLAKLGFGTFGQVATVFVVLDFTYYLYHFLMHKIKSVWRFHAVHHSDPVMNVSTSLREHPVETGIRVGHYMLAVWLLAPTLWIVTLHQFVQILTKIIIHSNFRLPEKVDKYLSLVLLTPNMHHVHHHDEQPYTDSNFGDLFSIWDRMFGTFRHLPAAETHFGLDTAPASAYNLDFKHLMTLPFDEKFRAAQPIMVPEKATIEEPPFLFVQSKKSLRLPAVLLLCSISAGLFMGFTFSEKSGKPDGKTSGNLVFHLAGLTPNRGWARVVLYDSPDKYLSQFGFCAADSAQVGADGRADIVLKNLPFGKYAGSFYQDENHNYVIDRNFAGLPTEPYGFSNSVRAKWSVPSFQSVSFVFEKPEAEQRVRLAYWSKQ